MGAIEISVVIPTYNREEMLQNMLEELSRQTMSPGSFEVIVVVDGATDGTWEMLKEIKTPYPLRCQYQENAGLGSTTFNSGVSVARNRGAALAQGQVILFLDDDLIPMPNLLSEHARIHLKDPNAVVLGLLLPSNETANKRGWDAWGERTFQTHYSLMAQGVRPASGWRLYSANFSVGRQQFLTLDGFDLGMGHVRGEDVELGFRLEDVGATYYFASGAAAVHRGFRTFTSWLNSAHVLGVRDVVLAEEKGRKQVKHLLCDKRRRQTRLVAWLVWLSLGNRTLRSTLVHSLRFAAGALSGLRLHTLAHQGYSLIFNLQYWNGVAEELGGKDAFMRFGNSTMQSTLTEQR